MEKNNSFIFGLVSGVAAVSTVVLIVLVIYMLTGGRAACFSGSAGTGKIKSATKFEECLASTKYDSKINSDQSLGSQLGVNGTPATFINGYLMSGALPFEAVKQVIDALLAGKEINEKDFSFMADQDTGKIVKVDMPQISSTDHVTGASNGKIVLVEFSDFECPYCGKYKAVVDQVLEAYPNDVTLVFKQFPLPASMHPNAKPAAVASECAAEQGKFWEMYDKLFGYNTSGTLNSDNIKKAAGEIGLK